MARPRVTEREVAGNDSFLDVTTNIVGILIILVMVVGERAKNLPNVLPAEAPSIELVAAQAESQRLEDDVHQLTAKMTEIQAATQAKVYERGQLSVVIAAIEQEMNKRREALDDTSRQRYEFDRELALARDELGRLEIERQMAENTAKPETIEIENHPTPIGKIVDDNEAHVQLSRGRLVLLPYEMLMDRLRGTLRGVVNEMGTQSERVETLGPIEGFRLRYLVQRTDLPQGSLFQLAYVEFLPVSSQLGDSVDDALRPDSNFRRALERMSPSTYTITIWTYPDSFADFARLKKELYAMGYTVAARPLPEGKPIAASPAGSKSSAQ
jgi:hypothetical protein